MSLYKRLFNPDKYFEEQLESKLGEVLNKDVKQSPEERGIDIPKKLSNFRYRKIISDWSNYLQSVKNLDTPRWNDLLSVYYQDVLMDATVITKTRKRLNKTILQDFRIYDEKTGKTDEILTKKWENKWFRDFQEQSISSIFFGFSLIQLGSIVDDVPEKVELVDRYYVIPERREIRKGKWDTTGVSFEEDDISKFLVWVQTYDDNKESFFGLFNNITPFILYKKQSLNELQDHISRYGSPTTMVTKRGNTDNELILNMLKYQGAMGYGLLPEGSEYEVTPSSIEHAENIYTGNIKLLDEYIGNIILENLTDSNNYSQSAAIQKWSDEISWGDNVFVSDIINNTLLPKFINELGLTVYEGMKFEFSYKDTMTIQEELDRDVKLMEYFDFDIDYIQEKYDVKLEGKREFSSPLGESKPPLKSPLNYERLEKFYNQGKDEQKKN